MFLRYIEKANTLCWLKFPSTYFYNLMLFSWCKSLVVLSIGIRDSFVTFAAIMID